MVEETATAMITRIADRARDRHAREGQYQAYEHYLHLYWIHRTAQIEIVDEVAKGGDKITFNVTTLWKLDDLQAELRFFFRGIGTVAEYSDNRPMTTLDDSTTRAQSRSTRTRTARSRSATRSRSRSASSSTTRRSAARTTTAPSFLYEVGKGGLVPWRSVGDFDDKASERENSHELDERAWLGGRTTLPYQTRMSRTTTSCRWRPTWPQRQRAAFRARAARAPHRHARRQPRRERRERDLQELVGLAGPNYVNRLVRRLPRPERPCAGRCARRAALLGRVVSRWRAEDGKTDPTARRGVCSRARLTQARMEKAAFRSRAGRSAPTGCGRPTMRSADERPRSSRRASRRSSSAGRLARGGGRVDRARAAGRERRRRRRDLGQGAGRRSIPSRATSGSAASAGRRARAA